MSSELPSLRIAVGLVASAGAVIAVAALGLGVAIDHWRTWTDWLSFPTWTAIGIAASLAFLGWSMMVYGFQQDGEAWTDACASRLSRMSWLSLLPAMVSLVVTTCMPELALSHAQFFSAKLATFALCTASVALLLLALRSALSPFPLNHGLL